MNVRQSLAEQLKVRSALFGFLQTHPNPAVSEMAGMCGYNFLLIDVEHGVFNDTECLHVLQILGGSSVFIMVRLRDHDAKVVGRYLDMGVDGIVVPNVSTAEQARLLVRATDYPPRGTRGFGASLHRGTRYGVDVDTHLKRPRSDQCLFVIIESALGVENIEEIVAVDGVDGVIIGPFDLSAELGDVGDFSQPSYAQSVTRIERAAADHEKVIGTSPHPGLPLEELIARGYRLLIVSADMPLFREAMSAHVARAKAALGED